MELLYDKNNLIKVINENTIIQVHDVDLTGFLKKEKLIYFFLVIFQCI